MSALGYYITVPFLYLISILPFWMLYGLSDFLYLVGYKILGYRKQVVLTNLRSAFPEKSEKEIQVLTRKFYHYLFDLVLESFKTLTISPKGMLRHCYINPDAKKLFIDLAKQKKNIIIMMGHQGNWEWGGNTFNLQTLHQLYVIYHPLSNPKYNKLITSMRTRFRTKLIAMKDTVRVMLNNRDVLSATAFLSDQAPPPENALWINFLNQDTPVFMGAEKIAKKLDSIVIYLHIERMKRGCYQMHAEILSANPKETENGFITREFNRILEEKIREQPETWLWSHRRWKHKREVKKVENQIEHAAG